MNTDNPLNSGKTVGGGRYILNKPIGEQTNTWLAHDDVENKPAVLNFLPLELRQDPRALEELRNQINVLRDLSHPNVASIYELYEGENEETFISSEYIEGMNLGGLQQMQPNRVFSWTFLSPLLKQIFAALEFVHQNNLVQGSLKPWSLMLDRKGQIKLLDVGIAGILSNPLFAGPPQAGVGGLLPYLSPQQIDGNPPTPTDDIYSLGVTIYEFLTSTVPFHQGDLLPQIRNAQPETIEQRLAKLRVSNPVPPIITSMVMACLSKDPASRPQDIQTLARSLEFAEMAPPQATPAPVAAPVPTPPPEPEPVRTMPVQRVEPAGALEVLPPQRGVAEAKPVQRAKKPATALIIAAVVILVGGAAAFFFLSGGGPAETETPPEITKAPQTEAEKKLQEAEDAALKREIEAAKNAGKAPVPETTAPPIPAEETAEEKKARRLALEAVELKGLSEKSDSAYRSLFNGTDLKDWKGDSKYWSVEDGCITARSDNTANVNFYSYLVWQGGNVGDFELRFQFKAHLLKGNAKAYGGAVYRAKRARDIEVNGYECRLEVGGGNMGILTSRDRMTMISFTQKNVVNGDDRGNDKVKPVGDLLTMQEVSKLIKKEDWNEIVITAEGNHLTHQINGRTVADLTDDNERKRLTTGTLALMLYTGDQRTAFMQYKNIRLKRLSK